MYNMTLDIVVAIITVLLGAIVLMSFGYIFVDLVIMPFIEKIDNEIHYVARNINIIRDAREMKRHFTNKYYKEEEERKRGICDPESQIDETYYINYLKEEDDKIAKAKRNILTSKALFLVIVCFVLFILCLIYWGLR